MKKGIKDYIYYEKEKISNVLEEINLDLSDYVNKSSSEFCLYYKNITHSDLPTYGKATRVGERFYKDNLLYYIDEKTMKNYHKMTGKNFETAHQSNIGISKQLYEYLGIMSGRGKKKKYLVNDYVDVKLVNSSMKYFSFKYTKLIFDKLKKKYDKNKWNEKENTFNVSNNMFTDITIHCAAHGFGTAEDIDFHKRIRANIFQSDRLFLLAEKDKKGNKTLYIILDKNPEFYTLLGINDKNYSDYLDKKLKDKLEIESIKDVNLSVDKEKVNRSLQGAWRRKLALQMMSYSGTDGEVFCPITYITTNFDKLGIIFTASHIKEYHLSNDKEKYDINNGLLLVSNIDKLFDKHYFTITKDKKIKYSFLIEKNEKLKRELMINENIFTQILNDKRMKYLEFHRSVFEKCEEKRKKGINCDAEVGDNI